MIEPPPVIAPPQIIPELPPALIPGTIDLLGRPLTMAPPLTIMETAEKWMTQHKTTVYMTAGMLLLMALVKKK